ncbi:MAG: hypothetical protein J7I99_06100 [Methanophagales archaeon]|nr:hypothetical protein [Methanophagales archaeon]
MGIKIGRRVKHILDAIDLIEGYLKDRSYEEFEENRMLQAHIYEDSPGQFLTKLVKK